MVHQEKSSCFIKVEFQKVRRLCWCLQQAGGRELCSILFWVCGWCLTVPVPHSVLTFRMSGMGRRDKQPSSQPHWPKSDISASESPNLTSTINLCHLSKDTLVRCTVLLFQWDLLLSLCLLLQSLHYAISSDVSAFMAVCQVKWQSFHGVFSSIVFFLLQRPSPSACHPSMPFQMSQSREHLCLTEKVQARGSVLAARVIKKNQLHCPLQNIYLVLT